MFCLLSCYSEPTYRDNPIIGFKPVQNDDIHLLHIGNDGLKIDSLPRKEAISLWRSIEQQAIEISANDKSEKREEL